MEAIKNKTALISGASIAGFSAAWWMNNIGYKVTVVELANEPRVAGGAVNIEGPALDAAKRMGIFEQLKAERLNVELIEFKDANDVTEGSMSMPTDVTQLSDDEIEVERDRFIYIVHEKLKDDVEFIFNDCVTALSETQDGINATFKNLSERSFDLVLGCDGSHSGIRKLWFGPEKNYEYFLQAYFSITIVNKLLVKQKTMQMYNVPDKAVMLNAYKNKTDIIFCLYADEQIPYDYRNIAQQRKIITDHFTGQRWRAAELLEEVKNSPDFYFDKFCQIKMPTWTKGRVVLVGDSGYCASPAAGKGASLSVAGAASLADALLKHNGDLEPAFADYNKELRPFVEEVQAIAELNVKENFLPRTEEAIHKRNKQGF
ncbi:FAD-dependent monooxygenase [Mucilaginibacter rigui]|uniref:FAD-dependent monooxygenase n=1 Tax=Mucilaginibacter rigui TaxID=534635 RepID=A0ABR7X2I0_9SPHI|nr:FAD-dependent monooxygenase [Mucilaginibacter rigui]MBD1384794.1 FAD-dependent monooxygenase [Mucilaginibacter rigui]